MSEELSLIRITELKTVDSIAMKFINYHLYYTSGRKTKRYLYQVERKQGPAANVVSMSNEGSKRKDQTISYVHDEQTDGQCDRPTHP